MAWAPAPAAYVTTADYGQTPGSGINREDLIEAYLNIDPRDRPLLQSIGKTRMTHPTRHDWSDDTLIQPKDAIVQETAGTISLQEGVNEGAVHNAMTGTAPNRRNNVKQTFRADWVISGDQIAANPAGIGDLFSLEDQKWMDALLNAVEARCFSTDDANGSAITADPLKMKTLDFESSDNYTTKDGIISGFPTPASGTISNVIYASARTGSAGENAALTESMVLDMLQGCWRNGGKPTDLHGSDGIVRRMSRTFVGIGSAGVEAPLVRTTPVGVVQVALEGYDTMFGGLRVIANRWVTTATETIKGVNVSPDPDTGAAADGAGASGRLWALQRNLIRWAWFRPFTSKVMGLDGDRIKGMTVGSGTLEVRSQKAHGAVKRISDATV